MRTILYHRTSAKNGLIATPYEGVIHLENLSRAGIINLPLKEGYKYPLFTIGPITISSFRALRLTRRNRILNPSEEKVRMKLWAFYNSQNGYLPDIGFLIGEPYYSVKIEGETLSHKGLTTTYDQELDQILEGIEPGTIVKPIGRVLSSRSSVQGDNLYLEVMTQDWVQKAQVR